MRTKILSLVAVVAALAVGVSASSASFRSETSAKVTLAKAGAPATLVMKVDNTDTLKVPDRISSVVVTSKSAKFNSAAVPACTTAVPTNAAGTNNAAEINPKCPAKSKVGKGTWIANTGTPGQPIPADLGTLSGTTNIYNYKKAGGEQAALLMELMSDIPVPNAHQYIRVSISNSGVVTALVPNTADLPPAVANFLRNADLSYRTTSMAQVNYTINKLTPKKGKKPFFTMKNLKKIDFSVVLNRD